MKNITLKASEIASMVNGELFGDPDRTITGVAGIRDAKESDLSFVGSKTYEEMPRHRKTHPHPLQTRRSCLRKHRRQVRR